MARHVFGGLGDLVVIAGAAATVGAVTGKQTVLYPAAALTFWDAETGGVQYTDLQTIAGSPIAGGVVTATAAAAEVPRFKGPDEITAMFMDAGQGGRREIVATDLGDYLAMIAQVETKLVDVGRIRIDSAEPVGPAHNDVWVDTSAATNVVKVWRGSWVPAVVKVRDVGTWKTADVNVRDAGAWT